MQTHPCLPLRFDRQAFRFAPSTCQSQFFDLLRTAPAVVGELKSICANQFQSVLSVFRLFSGSDNNGIKMAITEWNTFLFFYVLY